MTCNVRAALTALTLNPSVRLVESLFRATSDLSRINHISKLRRSTLQRLEFVSLISTVSRLLIRLRTVSATRVFSPSTQDGFSLNSPISMSPSTTRFLRKLTHRLRQSFLLAYEPDAPPYRQPRWQPPGKLFDLTVIIVTVIVGCLANF